MTGTSSFSPSRVRPPAARRFGLSGLARRFDIRGQCTCLIPKRGSKQNRAGKRGRENFPGSLVVWSWPTTSSITSLRCCSGMTRRGAVGNRFAGSGICRSCSGWQALGLRPIARYADIRRRTTETDLPEAPCDGIDDNLAHASVSSPVRSRLSS